MTRRIDVSTIDSVAKRRRLTPSGAPYWCAINQGTIHVGYRKGRAGGVWVARWYLRKNETLKVTRQGDGAGYKHARGKAYHVETLPGVADDVLPANARDVLSFDQAIAKVIAMHAAATSPAAQAGPITVGEACEDYVAYLRAERKTADDAERRLRKHVCPDLAVLRADIAKRRAALTAARAELVPRSGGHWIAAKLAKVDASLAALDDEERALPKHSIADVPVAALTSKQVLAIRDAMVRRDPRDPEVERRSKDTANRVMTSFKAALNRAFEDEANAVPSDAAWRRVTPFEKVGRPREVFLDVSQSKRLVNAASGAFRNLVTAALLTGARPPHEFATLRVRDLDPRVGTLAIRGGKTGARIVTLTEEAIRFFQGAATGRHPDALLLPKDDGTAWGKNHHVRAMRDAVARAKLPADCTIYALRHTHASQALLNGINIKLLAENMGTSIAMIEKHYGKFLAASRRRLIEESGFKLGLPKRTAKVVALRA